MLCKLKSHQRLGTDVEKLKRQMAGIGEIIYIIDYIALAKA